MRPLYRFMIAAAVVGIFEVVVIFLTESQIEKYEHFIAQMELKEKRNAHSKKSTYRGRIACLKQLQGRFEPRRNFHDWEINYRNAKRELLDVAIDVNKSAVILVDIWGRQDGVYYNRRDHVHTVEKIKPFLQFVRAHGIFVIHLPHGKIVSPDASPVIGEFVINPHPQDPFARDNVFIYQSNESDDASALIEIMRRFKIMHLFYVGYHSNMCVTYSPGGVMSMRNMLPRESIFVIKDMSMAYENPDTETRQLAHRMALEQILRLHYGLVVSSKQFMESVTKSAPCS